MDLDTGKQPTRGVNELGDKTYSKWVSKLQHDKGNSLPPALRRALATHYASTDNAPSRDWWEGTR
jgi:hypothetical protein